MGKFILAISLFAFMVLNYSSSSEVPTIVWNIKNKPVQIQPISAFDTGMRDLFDNTLKDGSVGVVVFMVDRLSMEDLALQPYYEDSNNTITLLQSFLEEHPFTLYPNVKDPAKNLRKFKCGVEDIYMTANMEGRLPKALSLALDQSCVVVVHLPHSSSLAENRLLFSSEIFQPLLKTSKKNIVGIFTAKKSSWESADGSSRKSRGLLEVDDPDPHFLNVSGCIIMYTENVTLALGTNGSYALTLPPEATANCDGNNTELTLTFTESDKISKVVMKFEFTRQSTFWGASNVSVEITGEGAPPGEVYLHNMIEAPNTFSYSCGDLVFRTLQLKAPEVAMAFEGFQIQVYDIGSAFASSVNCVTWFTLPIWMGSFVVLLFLTILNCGVYHLFQAKTMDRFDDPKGKTITVPQTD